MQQSSPSNKKPTSTQQQPSVTPPSGVNGFAIASLITGILGIVVLGIVFGFVALSQVKESKQEGRGLAIAGIAISFAYLGLILLMFIFMFAVLGIFTRGFFNSSFFDVVQTTPSTTNETRDVEIPSGSSGLLPITFKQDELIRIDGKELRLEEVAREGEVLMVTISEKNTSSKPVTYDAGRYVLYSVVAEYDQVKKAGETVLGKGSLPAGDAVSGVVVFDVPVATPVEELFLQYEPASPAGTFQAVWDLE